MPKRTPASSTQGRSMVSTRTLLSPLPPPTPRTHSDVAGLQVHEKRGNDADEWLLFWLGGGGGGGGCTASMMVVEVVAMMHVYGQARMLGCMAECTGARAPPRSCPCHTTHVPSLLRLSSCMARECSMMSAPHAPLSSMSSTSRGPPPGPCDPPSRTSRCGRLAI